MNKAYDLTHINKIDLYDKLDINKIIHNYQGNDINIDNIYSFGKNDKINNYINENNILYAYWGYNGSNKLKDSFNKNGNYNCYQDVTGILKENIQNGHYRNMAKMKNKFNKDPLHGIDKRLFIKLKPESEKYINDLKSLKNNIDSIVNSFDNDIKTILTNILNNGNSTELKYYKNKFNGINEEYTEIKKNFSSMKEFNIPTVVSYINKVNKRSYILDILTNNQKNFRSFYETVINKKRLENIQIHNDDYIFKGRLTLIGSKSTIIDQLYNYQSTKKLFKKIFICKQFKKIKKSKVLKSKVLKLNNYNVFDGIKYGLIDDNIRKRLNIGNLAVFKK
tara:strand:- start:1338 stop:2342 length:1005 start_codon:yes stop_codon:yes gene_type:complete